MKIIETKELTKYYGPIKGIEKLNLTINKGEIYGFIGPNGAGKSTTIRTLLNYIFQTSGSAKIFNKDIIEDTVEIRKNIGYISAEVNFYEDLTCLELLKHSKGFYKNVNLSKITELSERLKLDLLRNTGELSLGNKKKLAIIDALIHEPKLLILDEPTSGLDPLMQNEFYEILKEEKKKGTTILFSSHNLNEVKILADRIGFIKDGKIIKEGKTKDLLKADFKKITIFSKEVKKFALSKNMIIKKQSPDKITFLFNGDLDDLFKRLTKIKINDLNIEDLTIEELFLHYYQEEK